MKPSTKSRLVAVGAVALLMFFGLPLTAQQQLPVKGPFMSSNPPPAIPLWEKGAPGFENRKDEKEVIIIRKEPGIEFPVLTNVHNPSITPFLPAKEKATGAAIIIAPGGGHMFHSVDHEGYDVAKWLSEHGIAAFVLKYRLARQEGGSPYKVDPHALQDGQRAIRLVRSRAAEWNVDPNKVGIMGFSAGGEVASLTVTKFDNGNAESADPVEKQKSRPNFQVLIYSGGAALKDPNIDKTTPPAFLLAANNDNPSVGLVNYWLALKKAGVVAELHIYGSGGHGFGIRDNQVPISAWPDRLIDWMADQKLARRK